MTVLNFAILLVAGWGRVAWQSATLYTQSSKVITASDQAVTESVSVGAAWSWAISSLLGGMYLFSIHAWPLFATNLGSVALQLWVLGRAHRGMESRKARSEKLCRSTSPT